MRETCIVVKLNQSKDTQKKYKKLPDRGKFCIKIIIILTPDFSSTVRVFRSHQCILSKFWVKMLLNLDFYTLQWVIMYECRINIFLKFPGPGKFILSQNLSEMNLIKCMHYQNNTEI